MQLFASAVLVLFWALASIASALPLSDCYALSKDNFLYDFTDKIGRELQLEGEDSDFILRFCVDVQNRSNNGYINYGRFSPQSELKYRIDDIDFFQEYKYGDLIHCEHNGNDFTGREAEVKIMCGTCPNGIVCKDDFGCICNVIYNHDLCKAKLLAAVDCSRQGPRIFSDFSIGLWPRGSEVVKYGITQREYRRSFHNYSFESGQKSVSLYVTNTASFPGDFGKAYIQVQPPQGLWVRIENKDPPSISSATETTTLLEVDWKCEEIREQPYEVNIRIPIEGYDPIEFFLCKKCRTQDTQTKGGLFSMKMLEAVSLIILVGVTLFGITYKCKLQKEFKADATITMPLVSESLDEVDGKEDNGKAAIEVPLV